MVGSPVASEDDYESDADSQAEESDDLEEFKDVIEEDELDAEDSNINASVDQAVDQSTAEPMFSDASMTTFEDLQDTVKRRLKEQEEEEEALEEAELADKIALARATGHQFPPGLFDENSKDSSMNTLEDAKEVRNHI